MSEILYWAHEVKGLTTKQRVVLTCLANMADRKGGDCYPKIELLVERTGLSRRSIFNALDELKELGLLKIENQTVDGSGWKRNSRYILPSATVCASLRQSSGAGDAPQEVQEMHHSGAGDAPQEPPTNNHPLKHSDNSCDFEWEFQDWWTTQYPDRDGSHSKAKAKQAYVRWRKKGVTREQIWQATDEYFRELEAKELVGSKFVKHATTFLNDEPWDK